MKALEHPSLNLETVDTAGGDSNSFPRSCFWSAWSLHNPDDNGADKREKAARGSAMREGQNETADGAFSRRVERRRTMRRSLFRSVLVALSGRCLCVANGLYGRCREIKQGRGRRKNRGESEGEERARCHADCERGARI